MPLYGQRVLRVVGLVVRDEVLLGEVPARRQVRLEAGQRPARLCQHDAVQRDAHAARARHEVDAVVGVARVDEDLLVLLVPVLDGIPVERHAIGDGRRPGQDLGIAPDLVLGDLAAHADRPVARVALERAVRRVLGRLEQVEADVRAREVPDRQVAGLVQQRDVAGVDDGLAADDPAHAPGRRLEVQRVPLRRIGLEVERPCRLLAERACAHGQSHDVSNRLVSGAYMRPAAGRRGVPGDGLH